MCYEKYQPIFIAKLMNWIKLQCMFIQWNVHNYNNDGGNIVCKKKLQNNILNQQVFIYFYLAVWNQHKKTTVRENQYLCD